MVNILIFFICIYNNYIQCNVYIYILIHILYKYIHNTYIYMYINLYNMYVYIYIYNVYLGDFLLGFYGLCTVVLCRWGNAPYSVGYPVFLREKRNVLPSYCPVFHGDYPLVN